MKGVLMVGAPSLLAPCASNSPPKRGKSVGVVSLFAGGLDHHQREGNTFHEGQALLHAHGSPEKAVATSDA